MISARLINTQTVVVDFGQPVKIQNGPLAPDAFLVNSASVVSVAAYDEADNILQLQLDKPLLAGESWLSYSPAPATGPQLVTIVGVPTQVLPFEVLILEGSPANPLGYDVLHTQETPTLGDFIDAYGLREAIDISNPNDRNAKQPDEIRIIRAIEDASAVFASEIAAAPLAGLLILNAGRRRTILTIARYFLDAHCPREHVVKAYEEVIRTIKATVAGTTTSVGVADPLAYTGTDDFEFYYNEPCPCNSSCVTSYQTW